MNHLCFVSLVFLPHFSPCCPLSQNTPLTEEGLALSLSSSRLYLGREPWPLSQRQAPRAGVDVLGQDGDCDAWGTQDQKTGGDPNTCSDGGSAHLQHAIMHDSPLLGVVARPVPLPLDVTVSTRGALSRCVFGSRSLICLYGSLAPGCLGIL